MTGFEPVLIFAVIGLGVMLAARAPLEKLHGALLAALCFTGGVYAVTVALMGAALATGRFFLLLAWMLALLAAGAIVWKRRELTRRASTVRESFKMPPLPAAIAMSVLALICLYNFALVTGVAYAFPVVGYDAISNYMMKAALWFHTRELFPEQLTDPEFVMYHRRYPAAIPVAEMIWFAVLGGIELVKIKGFFLTCLALGGAVVFALLRRRNGALIAWLGTAFWLMLPYHLTEYQGGAIDGYPEMPLILGALCALAAARELGHVRAIGPAAFMAFIVSGPVLIKQEGLVFSFFLTVYLLLRRAPLRNIALIGVFTMVNLAIWQLAGRGLPDHLDESYFAINITAGEIIPRLATLRDYARGVFSDELQWGMAFSVLAVVWVFRLCRVPPRNWVTMELILGGVMTVFYIATLINTPLDLERHLESTTDRLFLHSFPLYIIATFDKLETARPMSEFILIRRFLKGRSAPHEVTSHDA